MSGSLDDLEPNDIASRASMIADVLALCSRRRIPLQDGITTLPFYRSDRPLMALLIWLGWVLTPLAFMLPLSWLRDMTWSYRLRRFSRLLDGGVKLSAALRTAFPGVFPEFYLLGIERAEQTSRVETALPTLAAQLSMPFHIERVRRASMLPLLCRILALSFVLSFLTSGVLPKFAELSTDILGGTERPAPSLTFPRFITPILQIAGLLSAILILLPRCGRGGAFLAARIPIIGGNSRRMALAELAQGMAAFTRQGESILTAAEWCSKASRSRWLQRRLEQCILEMRKGIRWDVAWNGMQLGRPLDQWVIANAASREDPASGFELVAEWLHQEIRQSTRRLERWIEPIGTLAIGLIVWLIADHVFSTLTAIMQALM